MGAALREKIIDCAERVLMRKGLTGATLDEIAAEAGITKGGVFYYFSGKQEIILILIKRYEERIMIERDRILETLPDVASSPFRAMITAMIEHTRSFDIGMSNIGGLFDVPEYREAIAGVKKHIFDAMCAGFPHPEHVAMALVTIDGLWMNNMFDTPFYYEGCRDSMIAILEKYIDSVCSSLDSEKSISAAQILFPGLSAESENLYDCFQAQTSDAL